jgi:hypothetical protein
MTCTICFPSSRRVVPWGHALVDFAECEDTFALLEHIQRRLASICVPLETSIHVIFGLPKLSDNHVVIERRLYFVLDHALHFFDSLCSTTYYLKLVEISTEHSELVKLSKNHRSGFE